MRKMMVCLLISIFSIVLCFNVLRTFFIDPNPEGGYSTVSVWTILDAASEFNVDSTRLYSDLAKSTSLLASVGENFTDAFQPATYSDSNNIIKILVSFFSCIIKSLFEGWKLLYTFSFVIGDVMIYVWQFITGIFKFTNRVLGSIFDTTSYSYT